ncbi:PA14 domain-containing protein [Hymenobacter negativus]|uniref:T9SS type A sorting domain-containing protein n=1 Tax=Hymenobacter negativus TaxID=2795026 RepID=A0ABS3QLB2_9BACT|nr:PA14 domain-containing protein [Hymenobacter negativus]MBO2012043.1 T9SS type A sorting domain-containing protein [Hymenobacter negativus]
MKNFFSLMRRVVLLWLCFPGFAAVAQVAQTADTYMRPYTEAFQYGANMGYYGAGWDDESLANLLHQAGGHSLRPTLPEWLVEYFGYNARVNTFNTYVNNLEMKEMSCFVGDPIPGHRDFTTYPGCSEPSKMFSHMYEPIWNADGTVNKNNYYAYYLYQLLQLYGDKVRFWEIMNEPDFTNGGSGAAWLTRAPTPAEQINTQAPFYFYIRMLRISYEVIKKYHPEAYIAVGAGYPEYVDALMRYTDEPNAGAATSQYPRTGGAYFDVVSYHAYPNYSLHYWDNSIGGFRYTRTSDYAANKVIEFKNEMTAVLSRHHYDGTLHPAKYITLNESNVGRRTSDDRISSDEAQRNFAIKSLVLTQKNDVKQFYYYAIGEKVDAPAVGQSVSGGDEIGLMGLYENLYRDGIGAAKLVQAGHAFATTSKMLYGYKYDATRTAALNLPTAVDGAAFSNNGAYVYVLWAKALVDNLEQAATTYSFPVALNLSGVQRYEWDYSVTGVKTTQGAVGIALTETPAFFVPSSSAPVVACSATGSLLREQWSNASGATLADIPLTAAVSTSSALPQLETGDNYGFNYGARLRGYVCPPQSGAYTFYITGDDQAELWLSSDADPAHATRIASCLSWTSSAHDFYRYASQQSAAITLVAGTRYYLEARHKQGWGPGYVAVAWRLPSGSTEEPIPGTRLSPFVPVVTPPVQPPAVTCSATGSLLREQWTGVSGGDIADIPLSAPVSSSSALSQLEAADTYGFNYGARLRGYVCPPQTGAYTFYITGDDQAELWLSSDADPAHATRIASCLSWTSSAHDFYRYASQQSAAITLVAGTRYYLEARHKQGWGPGYVAVAWRLPSGSTEEPIPGTRLSPFVPASARGIRSTGATPVVAQPGSTATELLVAPNPFSQQASVQFNLTTAGPVNLAVYDVQGKLVRQLLAGPSDAGISQRFPIDAQGLSSGLYVLKLVTAQNVLTQKLMLSK